MITKDQILKAKRKTAEVDVPEWGDEPVLIGVMSANQLAEYMSDKDQSEATSMLRFVVRIILDPETKERMFSDDDIQVLGEQSMPALMKVYNAGAKLHGLDEESMEAQLKNSGTTDVENSISS